MSEKRFSIENNMVWDNGKQLTWKEILKLLMEQDNEINRLKHELTMYQYENEKHIEARKLMLDQISDLQKEIILNKTEKEKKLEEELHECEKFRHSVFSAVERMAKRREWNDE